MVEAYHQEQATRSLTAHRQRFLRRAPANLPQVGVVEMDGGRIRTREDNSPRGVTSPHWREFQAGCVVRLQSEETATDPRPEVPRLFLSRPKVQKLVSQLHRQRSACIVRNSGNDRGRTVSASSWRKRNSQIHSLKRPQPRTLPTRRLPPRKEPRGPVRLQRTCVATLEGADACGRTLAAEAAQRGLNQAPRKGFVGDGQSSIWAVWKRYFERLGFVPILDFIHLLSYVYALAMAVGRNGEDGWQRHVQWITMLWNGQASEVLTQWRAFGEQFDVPTGQSIAGQRSASSNPTRHHLLGEITWTESTIHVIVGLGCR